MEASLAFFSGCRQRPVHPTKRPERRSCSSKMHVRRQPKVSALLRISAVGCALLWFVGITVSGVGCVCNCAGHEKACSVHEPHDAFESEHGDAHAVEARQHATASHHDDGEAPQGHCGKNGCKEQCRCAATIKPLSTTMVPLAVLQSVSKAAIHIALVCPAREYVFAAGRCEPVRPMRPHHWVFTPEVCLGPAFRSHAPPVSV